MYAVMLAYVGRAADATREAEQAVAGLQAKSPNDANLPYIRMQGVRVYLANGQHEKAIDELEKILASRSDFSPGYLRAEPTFRVLRGNARFEKLINAPASVASR